MESAGSEREIGPEQGDARPGSIVTAAPATSDERELLRRARETFRFGPDGRLLPAPRPGAPDVAGSPSRSAAVARTDLEALRSWVSHDPVLDECFEEALALHGRAPAEVDDDAGEDVTAAPATTTDPTAVPAAVTAGEVLDRSIATDDLPAGDAPLATVVPEPTPTAADRTVADELLRAALIADALVPDAAGPPAGPSTAEPPGGEPATNGVVADEAPRNGSVANGSSGNGSVADGSGTNGSVPNGVAPNGTNGVAPNGTNGVAPNGTNGVAPNGTNGSAANRANGSVRNGTNGSTPNGTNGSAPNRIDGAGDPDPRERSFPPPNRSRRERPILEWPEPLDTDRRADAVRNAPPADVTALASALGSSPEVEIAFAHTLAIADAPMGSFRWPSGSAQWANGALEDWLAPGGHAERTFVALLDEWSQAHFLVRILPELLRRGRWRGQLTFAADGRTESMLVTLVAHDDDLGGTDAVSVLAMPLGSIAPPVEEPFVPVDPRAGIPERARARSGSPNQLFNALVQHVSDLIVVTDPHGRITFASPAARVLLDLAPAADGVRPNLLAIMHPDNRPTTLAALARRPDEAALPPHPLRVLGVDGSWRDLSGVLSDLTDSPAVGGYVLNARDVTDAVRAEQTITDRAFTDELTGLANRVRLLDRLEGVAHANPPGSGALVVLGLDHLKRVGAEHGPAAIDIVLAEVGARLGHAVTGLGGDAVAARLQGDEFAIFVPGTDDITDAMGVAGQLRLALREPIRIGDDNVVVAASFGVTTSAVTGTGDAFDEILARADLAMREAKARGRDRTLAYDANLADRRQHRRGIDQQLRRAIDSDGLRIQFQPIVELASGRIVGAEALLRVRGDDGELLSPGAFVEAAESSGLISRLGAAVLRTTCEQSVALDLEPGGFPISVNVSPRQIADKDFGRRVMSILDDTGLAPRQLSLEITEGAFVGRDDASETNIIGLRDEGVRIGLDEFGGDTSLGYLRRFPLDFVKIDRRLIAGLGSNYVDGTIVRAAIELAHKLGLRTVAVGVELDEQQHRLEQLGCDRAQGYLFGSAVAATELARLVRSGR